MLLSNNYTTPSGAQEIIFKQTGRAAEARTEDGTTITYALNVTLPFSGAPMCDWSGVGTSAEAGAFWSDFLLNRSADQARTFFIRVNRKALDQENGEHRTEVLWFVENQDIDADPQNDRVLYELKAGTPGDLLGGPHAVGSFSDNGTKTLKITGGAVRLSRSNCGEPGTVGCNPGQGETVRVASLNPLPPAGNAQVFTATVTP